MTLNLDSALRYWNISGYFNFKYTYLVRYIEDRNLNWRIFIKNRSIQETLSHVVGTFNEAHMRKKYRKVQILTGWKWNKSNIFAACLLRAIAAFASLKFKTFVSIDSGSYFTETWDSSSCRRTEEFSLCHWEMPEYIPNNAWN